MAKSKIEIRSASAGDLDALAPLSEQLGYPVAREELAPRLAKILEQPDHALLVAQSDGKVVGWVHGMLRSLLVEGAQVFIGGLVVDAKARGQRIGEQLMSAIEDWGRGKGAHEVYVYSNIIRERAHRFYVRLGYEHHKTSNVFRKHL